ncbi:putative ascorbate ferrireductase (transmembrane) [Helianthus debilis subsp. tardiflorus]
MFLTVNIRGGCYIDKNTELSWRDGNKVHPVLMVIGLLLLNGEAMLAYKTVSGTKGFKKLIHLTLQFSALVVVAIGLWLLGSFTTIEGFDNFYSLHSWLGLACLFLFASQWGAEFATFWYPGGSAKKKNELHLRMALLCFTVKKNSSWGFVS